MATMIKALVSVRFRTMAPTSKSRIHRIVFAAFVVSIAWLPTARADDIRDRGVHFHTAASPLASALIEFSPQSGIQVAVAHVDVSHLYSNGVNGAYPIHEALRILLHDTGLEFSRVGVETVAISNAPVEPAVGSVTRAGGLGAAAEIPAANSSQPDSNVKTNASSEFPDVTVTTPSPPTDQELVGDSLYQFIVHHATVHYVNTGVLGSLTRWRGGRPESICPLTLGLDPRYNAFVTARLRELAVNVGAPVQLDLHCKGNVRFLFTTEPQKLMAELLKWAGSSLGVRYPHQTTKQLMLSSSHVIQGWYITAGGGGSILSADAGLLGPLNLLPLWPLVIQSGLHGGGGGFSGIVSVILVVDTTKVAGYAIGTIADYMATLALSVVQSPDHCDPLPSILDLMSSSCSTREKPTAITAGDLAFLKAL
jgi:hypothetical protein